MRYRNTLTGIVIHIDAKIKDGKVWECLDAPTSTTSDITKPKRKTTTKVKK